MTLEALAAETTQLVTSVLTAGSSGIIVATPALAPERQTGFGECISPAFAWAATAQRSGSKSSSSSWHPKASMSPSPQWPSVHSSAACCRNVFCPSRRHSLQPTAVQGPLQGSPWLQAPEHALCVPVGRKRNGIFKTHPTALTSHGSPYLPLLPPWVHLCPQDGGVFPCSLRTSTALELCSEAWLSHLQSRRRTFVP